MAKPLDIFGQEIMENIRDNGIELLDSMMAGKMKDEENIAFHATLSNLPPETQNAIRDIVIASIDTALFDFLSFFENSDEWKISNTHAKLKDLAEKSDGLSGELFGENGWISKYSQY